ncbi:MAG TPA: SPOR domain-containing protein [Pyrinomonadaceae bacterium]|jgi:cell division septation protein DedD|nr:SPOR domain-containing protein [Pyrinomonadaceae bacterium]
MRIICPKCELKGQVDVAPAGAKTRIACVRCATTFDAVFVDGEIQALLPQASQAVATIGSVVSESHAGRDVSASVAEFTSTPETPREEQFEASLQVEESPVPADDFAASSPDLMSEASVETVQAAPQEISHELLPQSVETRMNETTDAVQDSVVVAQSLKSDGALKASRPPADVYGMGVRLMRVSPAWLLLAGLSFISFIVFCNWLIKPAAQPEDMARLTTATNNHATNQSGNRIAAPTPAAQSPVNNQAVRPSNEPGVAYIAAEAKEVMPPVAAPSVELAEAKPAVEEKAASSSKPAGEAKEGKVTIQVGSYNAATEAEARVANLKSAGFEARSVEVVIPKRGTWYRVQSGRFVNRDEAERYGRQLRDKGIVSSFITTDVQE